MLFEHIMSIPQQLIPIYNTTVHNNKSDVALNVDKLLKTPTPHGQHHNGQATPDNQHTSRVSQKPICGQRRHKRKLGQNFFENSG